MGTYQFSVVHGIKSASDETDSLLKIAPSTRKKKDLPSTTACLQHSCLSMIRKEEKCFRLAVCDKKKKKGATGSNESANFHGRDACDCKEPFEVEA